MYQKSRKSPLICIKKSRKFPLICIKKAEKNGVSFPEYIMIFLNVGKQMKNQTHEFNIKLYEKSESKKNYTPLNLKKFKQVQLTKILIY